MTKSLKNRLIRFAGTLALLSSIFLYTGCWSVFSGGTGGIVVDAESSSYPKAGIANVDVYAYVDRGNRDSDFNRWKEETTFTPSGYYGHTTTGSDGSFVISKMIWKTNEPEFGRDGDYQTAYLLFYHENYGLTKGETVLISDTTGTTVYQELTAKYQRTNLTVNCIDVATDSTTDNVITVKISVPQKTYTKVYTQAVAGSGVIPISFPRENSAQITIEYFENSENKYWLPCYNQDNAAGDFSFRDLEAAPVTKVVPVENSFTVAVYGKSCRLSYPVFSGTCGDVSSVASDGLLVELKGVDANGEFTVDLGNTYSEPADRGTNGAQTHGHFSGLGGSVYKWTDKTYTNRYSETKVKLLVGNGTSKEIDVRSDNRTYNIAL